ncbi:MAG: PKD domain-containing protein [Bacteroidetes bacterium]|nr:PKD domain-containing protein [Bacteroidota bacterium]
MKIYLLLFLFIITQNIFAQKEATNWYFGERVGLSFSSGLSSPLGGGKLFSIEGCAVVSDPITGALLFYSDGTKIWNRNHEVINSGNALLKGGISSTQNVLIVPKPGNKQQYYVFTVPDLTADGGASSTGLYYSLLNVDNGNITVLTSNILLTYGVSEKITGTLDCNGTGFWVVTHDKLRGKFYSYHISSSGIDPVPVTYEYNGLITSFTAGCMKISPDRTKLALASNVKDGYIVLFDFNAKTGKVSNYKFLVDARALSECYGLSFSPDNTKLYVSAINNSITPKYSVYQLDISLPSLTAIQNSVLALNSNDGYIGGMQIAPDGKIYIAKEGVDYLDVIEKPNLKGDRCNYQNNGLQLTGLSRRGLPNFMDYIFNTSGTTGGPLAECTPPRAIIKSDTGCADKIFRFADLSTNKPTQRQWSFTGGTPATSTDSSVFVNFAQAGTFQVRLVVSNDNGRDTTFANAVALPVPKADAGADKTVCIGESTQIGIPPEPGNTYLWEPFYGLDDVKKANPIVKPANGTTEYTLTVTNSNGCISHDTVYVTVGNIVAKVSKDTAICTGASVQLLASGGSEYQWTPSTGLNDPTLQNPIASPTITTQYKVRVSSGSCEDSTTVTVVVNQLPLANAGQDQSACKGETLQLGVSPEEGYTYSWQPVAGLDDPTKSNPFAKPDASTLYILKVTSNTGCTAMDTVMISVGTLNATISRDTSICVGGSVKLFASGGSNYVWSPSLGLDNPMIANPVCSASVSTQYKVYVSKGFCLDSGIVNVTVVPLPVANAGEDKMICTGVSVQIGDTTIIENSYMWRPATGLSDPTTGKPNASPTSTTTYILNVSNSAGCSQEDTMQVTVNPSNERLFTLKPSLIKITPGEQFQTTVSIPRDITIWKIHLIYDKLIFKYEPQISSTNGIVAVANEANGKLTINGTGENGNVTMRFNSYLPYNSDTAFAIQLLVDSADVQ